MATLLRTIRDPDGNTRSFYDLNTQESVEPMYPQRLVEDFINTGATIPVQGAPVQGFPWVKRLVLTAGTPTAAFVANAVGGQVQLALDATAEIQEAVVYANDQLTWDLSKGTLFEARAALSVVPSVAGVEAIIGLHSAWVGPGPDNATYYARFQVNGSGVVNCQTKDGVNTLSVPTAFTLTAGVFHVFRIDLSDPTNVVFSIDGVNVGLPSTLTFAAAPPNSVLQPYVSVYKTASAGLATLLLDSVKIGGNKV
jgi:hypothetical protein